MLPDSEFKEEAKLVLAPSGASRSFHTPDLAAEGPQSSESSTDEEDEDLTRSTELAEELFRQNQRPVIAMATGGQKTTTTPAWLATTFQAIVLAIVPIDALAQLAFRHVQTLSWAGQIKLGAHAAFHESCVDSATKQGLPSIQ